MKAYILKLKEFFVESFKKVVKWMDFYMEKYIMNNNNILFFIYIFTIIYFIYFCIFFKLQNILLIFLLFFLIYFIKYIKEVVLKLDKTERIIIFNMLFLIINFLTIFFNVLRNLLQYYIRYIKNNIYILIEYVTKIDLSQYKVLNLVVNNMIPIVSISVIYSLVIIYISFLFWNQFFNFDKPDMEEKDFKNAWIYKYNKLYLYIVYTWLGSLICFVFFNFLIGIKIDLLDYIIICSFVIVIFFNLNGFYIILKFYLKNV